jgi:phospholipid transport system transporter-binding protein
MNNITQQENQWQVSGDVLMDNANNIVNLSNSFAMPAELVIDFSAVTDVDTAALSLLMEWQRRALSSNCSLSFKHLPEDLNSLAELYGVATFISHNHN